jgi:hypothetical protein
LTCRLRFSPAPTRLSNNRALPDADAAPTKRPAVRVFVCSLPHQAETQSSIRSKGEQQPRLQIKRTRHLRPREMNHPVVMSTARSDQRSPPGRNKPRGRSGGRPLPLLRGLARGNGRREPSDVPAVTPRGGRPQQGVRAPSRPATACHITARPSGRRWRDYGNYTGSLALQRERSYRALTFANQPDE